MTVAASHARTGTAPAAGRSRARTAVVLAVGATAGAALWGLATQGDGSGPAPRAEVATGVATVETRELVDREDVTGTLGFAGSRTVGAAAGGTLTRVADEGATVRRGRSLYAVDDIASGYVMYGDVPAWRALSTSVADGPDVEQLERNLRALGHDPDHDMTLDEDFDWATAAAVRRWQDARGVTETGTVGRGEVVFADGAVRVGSHKAEVGDAIGQGGPVTTLTERERIVTARLPAGRQSLVERGDAVTVMLPDGSEVAGRVGEVGRVASVQAEGEDATVALEIALRGREADGLELDGAPVTVSVAQTEAERGTAVPVEALLATGPGRYAVEVVTGGAGGDGARRLVPVELGAFADGYVAISGRGLRDGTKVTVPR